MRKITLVAAAALSAVTAMAAGPVAAKVDAKAVNAQKHVVVSKQNVAARFNVNAPFNVKEGSRAATATNMPLYATPASFYSGMDSNGYTYTADEAGTPYFFSIVAPNVKVPFVSCAENAQPTWNWTERVLNEEGNAMENASMSGEGEILGLQTSYFTQVSGSVNYTGTIDGSELTWANPALGIMSGRSFADWGVTGEEDGFFGVSPASAPSSGSIWGDIFSVDRSGAEEGYNVYGVSEEFAASEWGEEGIDPATVKLDAFASYIPAAGAPFQFRGLYFLTYYHSTEDMPLTVNVYNVDEEGNPDLTASIGRGTVVLPANEDLSVELPYVDIKTVNILGYTSDEPVISNGTNELYITIEGFNEEFVKQFVLLVSKCSKIPVVDWGGANFNIYRRAYPRNLDMRFSGKNTKTGETVELSCPHIHAYGDREDSSIYWMTTDFTMYYDIYFPSIFPAYVGQTFDVTIPVDGGAELCPVDGYTGLDSDIAQLCNDGVLSSQASAEWFTYEVAYDEESELSYVAVQADALPAGETGRYGEIKFTGYGCDFTITVTQGEAGINAVVANGNGVSEFYDLQGRKLNAAPAKGLYIERNGSAAATKLAR